MDLHSPCFVNDQGDWSRCSSTAAAALLEQQQDRRLRGLFVHLLRGVSGRTTLSNEILDASRRAVSPPFTATVMRFTYKYSRRALVRERPVDQQYSGQGESPV